MDWCMVMTASVLFSSAASAVFLRSLERLCSSLQFHLLLVPLVWTKVPGSSWDGRSLETSRHLFGHSCTQVARQVSRWIFLTVVVHNSSAKIKHLSYVMVQVVLSLYASVCPLRKHKTDRDERDQPLPWPVRWAYDVPRNINMDSFPAVCTPAQCLQFPKSERAMRTLCRHHAALSPQCERANGTLPSSTRWRNDLARGTSLHRAIRLDETMQVMEALTETVGHWSVFLARVQTYALPTTLSTSFLCRRREKVFLRKEVFIQGRTAEWFLTIFLQSMRCSSEDALPKPSVDVLVPGVATLTLLPCHVTTTVQGPTGHGNGVIDGFPHFFPEYGFPVIDEAIVREFGYSLLAAALVFEYVFFGVLATVSLKFGFNRWWLYEFLFVTGHLFLFTLSVMRRHWRIVTQEARQKMIVLYRRAQAHCALRCVSKYVHDCRSVLSIDPQNKNARFLHHQELSLHRTSATWSMLLQSSVNMGTLQKHSGRGSFSGGSGTRVARPDVCCVTGDALFLHATSESALYVRVFSLVWVRMDGEVTVVQEARKTTPKRWPRRASRPRLCGLPPTNTTT